MGVYRQLSDHLAACAEQVQLRDRHTALLLNG